MSFITSYYTVVGCYDSFGISIAHWGRDIVLQVENWTACVIDFLGFVALDKPTGFAHAMKTFRQRFVFDKNVLASVSLWHICSAVVGFVMNPKEFQVRVLNPVSGFDGRLRYLELYVLAIGAFIDMCIEFLYSTRLKFFVNGVLNPSHTNDFEHSGCFSCSLFSGSSPCSLSKLGLSKTE
ncbi:hypothetical protein CK203_021421 [Vitis vinifera]|uniref:Uncharacterized protein n=1 Tax=Vitis vinifera TaxID=29760 RepID=A0A438IS59_VITVI|nr:hypothetical protein CK203_021421 [Vitis vinifera]